MATKRYGTNATKVYAQGASPNAGIAQLADQPDQTGRIHTLYDEYTIVATTSPITSGEVIYMGGKIPQGARIVNAFYDSDQLCSGGGATLQVGWEASSALDNDTAEAQNKLGLFDTIDVHTAAIAGMLNTTVKGAAGAAAEGKFKKFTAAVQLALYPNATAVTPTAGKVFRLTVQYTFD